MRARGGDIFNGVMSLIKSLLESSLEDPRYSQEYLNHVIFASPEEVVLTAPDGSLGASERTAE